MPLETDRRVRRTRSLLHRALMTLIVEKGYSRITVQDILDRADVGRSTFYAHFRSKDDLFLAGGVAHLRTLFDASTTSDAGTRTSALLPPALALFRLAGDNRALYRALVGRRGSDLVERAARTMLTEVVTEYVSPSLRHQDERQVEMTVAFMVSGLLGLLTWWLDSDTPYSAEDMYEHFERLAAHGVDRLR